MLGIKGLTLKPTRNVVLPKQNLFCHASQCTDDTGAFISDTHPGVGNHEVLPGAFTQFNGTVYGKLVDTNGADTSITLSGAYTISFWMHTPAASSYKVLDGDATGVNRFDLNFDSTAKKFDERAYISSIVYSNGAVVSANTPCKVVIQGTATGQKVGRIGIRFDGVQTPYVGNLWDLTIEDSTGVIFSNPLAQNSTSLLMKSQIGPDVQFVNGTYPIVGTSNKYGYTWENYSEVENLLKYSEDFSDSIWVKTSCTVTPDFEAPDGTLTAYKVVFESLTEARVQQSFPGLTPGKSYTYSIYARAVTGTRVCRFGTSASIDGEFIDITLTEEWQRFYITSPASGPEEYPRIQAGSGGAGEILIWRFSATQGTSIKPYIKTTSQPISLSKVPHSLTDTSKDIFGNALTHPGTPRKNMKVYGYTGAWNGTAYANLATAVVLPGPFQVDILDVSSGLTSDDYVLSDGNTSNSNYIGILADSKIRLKINNSALTSTFSITQGQSLSIRRDAANLVTVISGSSTYTHGTMAGNFSITKISRDTASMYEGSFSAIRIYDASDTLIHHWICESSSTSLQDKIYDIVGGNHAPLTNATLPFFTTQKEGSALLAGGFSTGVVAGGELRTAPNNLTFTEGLSLAEHDITTGISHLQSDGTWAYMSSVNSLTAGKRYRLTYEIIGTPTGFVQLYNTVSPNLQLSASGTYDFIAAQQYIAFARVTPGCDVYFKASVKELPVGYIPATPSTNLSALGQPLTHPAGKLKADTPVLLEMLPCVDGWEADGTSQVSGVELWQNPTTYYLDSNNYSTFDPTTGIGRVICDGGSVPLKVFSVVGVGNNYRYHIDILDAPFGAIKIGNNPSANDILADSTGVSSVTIDKVAAYTDLYVYRVAACDITFKLSVREVLDPVHIFYETDGTVKEISPATLGAWTDGNVNNQYFFGQRGLALYKDPLNESKASRATNYTKPF